MSRITKNRNRNIVRFSKAKESASSKKHNLVKRNKRLKRGIRNHIDSNSDSRLKKIIKNTVAASFLALLFIFTIGILTLIGITSTYSQELPDIDKYIKESKYNAKESIIYDRYGKELYRLRGDVLKEDIKLEEVPVKLQWAFIATEDAQFWEHKGLNLQGLTRAGTCFARSQSTDSCGGGSSVTQQMVKIVTGSNEKTIDRKAREALTAMKVEQNYSKQQILEYYLNNVPQGAQLIGVKAGSKYLFGKEDLKDLTLQEMAYLAAIANEPTILSPWGDSNYNAQKSSDRAHYVLDRMLQEKHFTGVTEAEISKAKSEIPYVKFKSKDVPIKAPHFVDYVIKELDKIYASNADKGKRGSDYLRDKGYNIYTSVDLDVQELMESTIKTQIKTQEFQKIVKAQNAAGVVMDPKTGDILAMVGS
jgi:membrane peptidoglycan carboxypeptidase